MGIIGLAFFDVDHRNRLEPTDVLTVLRALKQSEGITNAQQFRFEWP
jgi:hypothetical protein